MDAAFGVEHEDGGVGDAVLLFSCVRFVAKCVAVDDARARIGEKGKRHFAAVIGGDELRELLSLRSRVGTDREELHLGIDTRKLTKSGNLPGAIRSPIAAIENEHDLRARRVGQADPSPILIEECEGGRPLSDRRRRSMRQRRGGNAGGDGEEQCGEDRQAAQRYQPIQFSVTTEHLRRRNASLPAVSDCRADVSSRDGGSSAAALPNALLQLAPPRQNLLRIHNQYGVPKRYGKTLSLRVTVGDGTAAWEANPFMTLTPYTLTDNRPWACVNQRGRGFRCSSQEYQENGVTGILISAQ